MIHSGFENLPAKKSRLAFLYSARTRLAAIAILTVIYILVFPPISKSYGPIIAPLVMIPVLLVGWWFGIRAGLIAGVTSAALNAALYTLSINDGWSAWNQAAWPGTIMIILAGYVSGAVRHGMDKQVRIEKDLRARERSLWLINISTQDIFSHDRAEDIYFSVISHLVNLLVADCGHLVLWDEAQEKGTLAASTKRPISAIVLDSRESDMIAAVLKSGRATVMEDHLDPRYITPTVSSKENGQPAQSAIWIPLIAKQHKLGAVIVAFVTPHEFSNDEIYHAELASKQIALSMWNILQDMDIQRRLHESDALASIGRALSETEQVGLDNVLQLIVDSAKELIPDSEQVVIHLLDEERQVLVPQAVTGLKRPRKQKLQMRLGEGVAGQVIADGVSINIADVTSDPRFLQQGTQSPYRSLLVSPVQTGNKRMGTISVQGGKVNAFTNREMQLLGSLGTQASIAIENARLLETTKQGLREVNALYRITQELAASLDTEHLMKEVVHLLQQKFGYYHVQIYVTDAETGDLVMAQGSGEIGRLLKSQAHRMKAGSGITGHVTETGLPLVTNNVNDVVFFVPNPLLPKTQSELAVPITIEKRVLGVLDVQNAPPARLTERDMQLVNTVADQLAVSLQKAGLYADLQASLAQEKSIRSQLIQSERLALVGRLLASVSHELNNPLQAIQNALFLIREEKSISAQGRQDLQIVLSETERMAGLIERLRTSYRSAPVEDWQPMQINNVIEDVYALMSTHLRRNNVAFEFHPDPDLPLIAGLPDQIRQVILNLLMNGVEAMPSGGRLTVSTQQAGQAEALLTVSDTGPGVDPEILPRIFDAFVTNKESGTGLGLTITYDIIHYHHGRIQAENNSTQGATFKIWFPIKTEKPA